MEFQRCKMSGQSELAQRKPVETLRFSPFLGRKDKSIRYIKKYRSRTSHFIILAHKLSQAIDPHCDSGKELRN